MGTNGLGMTFPIGWAALVPIMATGTIGHRHCKARRATPVWPRCRRPSGLRVPSG